MYSVASTSYTAIESVIFFLYINSTWYPTLEQAFVAENLGNLPPPPIPSSAASAKISEKLDDFNFLLWQQEVKSCIKPHCLQTFCFDPSIPLLICY